MKIFRKNLIILLLLHIFIITCVYAQADNISVYIDGVMLSFDVEPIIIKDRVMVPMRKIFETFGAKVIWFEKTQQIKAESGEKLILMQIGNSIMKKNQEEILLDVPPILNGDRTLVPIRAVSQSLGAIVKWDEIDKKVLIYTKVPTYPGYIDIPDYSKVVDCQLISENTSSSKKILLYQLKDNSEDSFYHELLKDKGYRLINTSKDKNTHTKVYRSLKKPNQEIKIVFLQNLMQTKIEITRFEKIKIFIDAGHNDKGEDNGAEANGLREQDVTYSIAKKLGALLQEAQIEVMYSREKKTDNIGSSEAESIRLRCEMANEFGVNYFISIHCNAFVDPKVSGTETFIYGRGGEAELLAEKVHSSLVNAISTVDRGIKVKNFGVLRMTKMPAILVETAFITNKDDAKILKEKQDIIAEAIFKGVCEYLGRDNNIY